MLLPNKIIVHCSATPDTKALSWEAIRQYHTQQRGWRDIGYHYGIERVDDDIRFLRGRPWWERGAHCRADNRNFDSLGLCVVGEYDEEPPPPEIYDATVKVLVMLCSIFWIKAEDVYGHREFEKHKTCPGMKWDLDQLRRDIGSVVPHPDDKSGMKIGEFK